MNIFCLEHMEHRIAELAKALTEAGPPTELYNLRSKHPEAFAEVQELMDQLEAYPDQIRAIIASSKPAPTKHLNETERGSSLARALHFVVAERGSVTLPADTVHALVLEHVPDADRPYWKAGRPGGIYGQVQNMSGPLAHELRALGISAEATRDGDGIGRSISLTTRPGFLTPPRGRQW